MQSILNLKKISLITRKSFGKSYTLLIKVLKKSNEIYCNDVYCNEVYSNEVYSSEVYSSKVYSNEVYCNDVY